jgi:hypothetical protein
METFYLYIVPRVANVKFFVYCAYAPEKVVLRIIPARAGWSVFVYNEVKMRKKTEMTAPDLASTAISSGVGGDNRGELPQESNMQILHNTLSKFKPTTIYSLDVIISVGYRVKSFRGTQFRQWANQVLKGYILKGYAVNQRKIATDLQIADRLHEQRQLIESQGAEIATMRTIHDRFLLVDDKVYHFGASFKDMGNEMTAFSVLDFVTPAEVIEKIQESMKGR